ncbi:hypothetical protein K504DRAFT_475540 [Pleomassaria siparia CBS 279.74]|uniref:Uncharacterized protein n=1 Tax=Pleomassaria siparia CBS 279.74 TaxID=1314801 RepID=A0A6G1KHA8_9PLEO|nr:hypothetical protein K504DRAFT_475540 [Pleomassaria siparia CBS 279.74]
MDSEEDPDIAAMMGFGSFGGTKKRKFDQTNSPKSKFDTSGANSTQLGVRTKPDPEDEKQKLYVTRDATITNNSRDDAQSQLHGSEFKGKGKGKAKLPEVSGLAAFLAHAHTLPENTPASEQTTNLSAQFEPPRNTNPNPTTFSYGGPSLSENDLYALRRGVKDEAGDMMYFLPSFVEDPWEKLVQQRR